LVQIAGAAMFFAPSKFQTNTELADWKDIAQFILGKYICYHQVASCTPVPVKLSGRSTSFRWSSSCAGINLSEHGII